MLVRLLDILGEELPELVETETNSLPAVIVWGETHDVVRVFVRTPVVAEDGLRTYHEVRTLNIQQTMRGPIANLIPDPSEDPSEA